MSGFGTNLRTRTQQEGHSMARMAHKMEQCQKLVEEITCEKQWLL